MSHQPPFDERPHVSEPARNDASRHRDYRAVPPHGDVSPDGRRAYPRPSKSAKWIVWGGTGLAAAGLAAGAVLAARQVADALSGSGAPRRRPYRPEDAPQPRMQLHAPAPETPRPERAAPERSLMEEIEVNSQKLSNSLDNVMRSVSSAVAGFHGVASQANSIVREFGDAAELIRGIIDGQRRPPASGFTGDRSHGSDHTPRPNDRDPRTHRL
ncbi:hypothetical protein [Paracoccus ravus]|uniref:hypothetical protein n=1 Tax=Paracoccus ravus TaxID=2447760 RepID=UPI00106EA681|nr:hypothetical protein [Paracoccus ravus]